MTELLAFAGGLAVALAATALLRRQRTRAGRRRPADPPAAARASRSESGDGRIDGAGFAHAMSNEIADIASGIEGGAYRLMESADKADVRAAAADNLWLAVLRLRRFHDKLSAYTQAPPAQDRATELLPLLRSLRKELQHARLGLEFSRRVPDGLRPLRGGEDALRDLLLFTCHALYELEPGALRLSVAAQPCYADEAPAIDLELQLEYDEDPIRAPQHRANPTAFAIAETAARNLVQRHGGTLAFAHDRGHHAVARLRLPAAKIEPTRAPAPAPTPEGAVVETRRHDYGGVLVLEGDPTVRSLLASELKAQGRAVFACADGAAVRSLLQATPQRFELLVVDSPSRLDAGDAAIALQVCPELKVFVLSAARDVADGNALIARAHRIQKPFGLQELRRALREVLAS